MFLLLKDIVLKYWEAFYLSPWNFAKYVTEALSEIWVKESIHSALSHPENGENGAC